MGSKEKKARKKEQKEKKRRHSDHAGKGSTSVDSKGSRAEEFDKKSKKEKRKKHSGASEGREKHERKKSRKGSNRARSESVIRLFQQVAAFLSVCLDTASLQALSLTHPKIASWFKSDDAVWWKFALRRSQWRVHSKEELIRVMDSIARKEQTKPEVHPSHQAFNLTIGLHSDWIVIASGQGGPEYVRDFIQREALFERTVQLLDRPFALSLRHTSNSYDLNIKKSSRYQDVLCFGRTFVDMYDTNGMDGGLEKLSTHTTWHCIDPRTRKPTHFEEFVYDVGGDMDESYLLDFDSIHLLPCPTCHLQTVGVHEGSMGCCWCLYSPATAHPSQVCLQAQLLPQSFLREYLHSTALGSFSSDPDFSLWNSALRGDWSSVVRVHGGNTPSKFLALYTPEVIYVRSRDSTKDTIITIPHPQTLPQTGFSQV